MKYLYVCLTDANSKQLTSLTTLGQLSNRFDKVNVDASSSEVIKAFAGAKVNFTSATAADLSLEEVQAYRNSLYVVVDQTMDFKNANDSLISLLTAANKDNAKIIVISDPADYSLLFQANFISQTKKQALQRKVCAKLECYYHYKATTAASATASATSTSSSTSGTVVKRVLVVGSGGREHAIVHQLLSSHDSGVTQVYVAPGNAGTQGLARCENVAIGVEDVDGLVQFAQQQCVDLVIVGPEQPLVLGLVDAMHIEGIPCFGPNQAASIIEASKAWSKDFMARHGIPTAAYRTFTEAKAAKAYVAGLYAKKAAAGQVTAETPLVVVKASGLAAGKGVLVPLSLAEAIAAIEQVLEEHAFGTAGNELIVEEYLVGEEISLLAFADGRIVCGMPPAQDHKRVFDGDLGLNTGGMGAYAPTPCIDSLTYRQCLAIVQQTVTAMQQEGRPFHGVLYAGFILTKEAGPMVLEYNARFGDPETQVLMPLLLTNLAEVALACVEGRLAEVAVNWRGGMQAATVVLAAPGYPEANKKGVKVLGLDAAVAQDTIVYHAGTAVDKANSGAIVSNGGRLLAITGLGKTLQAAVDTAYRQIRQGGADKGGIRLEGNEKIHYRTDIAKRGLLAATSVAATTSQPAIVKAVRIGVLGSTRGSSLQPILDAIQQGTLPGVTVSLVISNKKESGILARARSHGIPAQFLGALNKTREQYDAELAQQFLLARCDLVLLIGCMRIVSLPLIQAYPDRLFNVHPSLLPDFAGGMDLEVHRAVLAAGKIESGCTVHVADESLDGGRIVVQKRVAVAQDGSETAESLKAKVQALEGPAFMEVIRQYQSGQLLSAADDSQPWNNKPARSASVAATKAVVAGSITYRDAGVDIDAGEALVDPIKPYCKATVRSGCDAELGGFGGLFDLAAAGYDSAYLTGSNTNSSGVPTPLATYDPIILVSGTDGVGTKLKIAQSIQQHDTIGIDLVAMCVNDILICGAEPLFFLDYYATGALQVQEASLVVKGIAQGCAESGCTLIGGETAEMAGKED